MGSKKSQRKVRPSLNPSHGENRSRPSENVPKDAKRSFEMSWFLFNCVTAWVVLPALYFGTKSIIDSGSKSAMPIQNLRKQESKPIYSLHLPGGDQATKNSPCDFRGPPSVEIRTLPLTNFIQVPKHIWGAPYSEYENYTGLLEVLNRHPFAAYCEAKCNSNLDSQAFHLEGACRGLWPSAHIVDTELKDPSGYSDPAEASLPCFLYLAPSTIPGAGKGVFTRIDLPSGLFLGPYKGKKTIYEPEHNPYIWMLAYDNGTELRIDAGDPHTSNGMRYVNTADYQEHQNMFPLPVRYDMYYVTYKNIPRGTELLTYYGSGYARGLGIQMRKGAWTISGMAPYRKDIVAKNLIRNPKRAAKIETKLELDGQEKE